MSEATKIEWCDSTFNPWTGCTKVSPGCDACYAEAWSKRAGERVGKWGPGAPRVRTSAHLWRQPLKWDREHAAFAAEHGRRRRVFCASLADVFDNEVNPTWRVDLFDLISRTTNLDWLLLTKRIGNAKEMIDSSKTTLRLGGWKQPPGPLPNVWLGATVVNQEEAERDIPKLLTTPASVRFLSMEPLIGHVDLARWLPSKALRVTHDRGVAPTRLDWVIVGGESGTKARPMHPDWASSLRDQCAAAGVPLLFKQWGEWLPVELPSDEECYAADGSERAFEGRIAVRRLEGHVDMARVGKRAAGRLLDGVTLDGYPKVRR